MFLLPTRSSFDIDRDTSAVTLFADYQANQRGTGFIVLTIVFKDIDIDIVGEAQAPRSPTCFYLS